MKKPKRLTLDDLRAANSATRHGCSLSDLLNRIPTEDAATVRDAIDDHSIQATAIHRVLKARYGWNHGEQVVMRHRRGECVKCRT